MHSQVPKVGKQLGERLAAAGITSLQGLQQAGARQIESITQRNYPFGEACWVLLAMQV